MEKDIIQKKIRGELNNLPIDTEARASYFFIEIRKVLDHLGDKDTFEVLRLYADWCVHTELDRRLAKKLYKIIIQDNVESSRILSFGKLREELRVFLDMCGLPTEIATNDELWSTLRSNLSKVLIDIPIIYKDKDGATGSFQFQNRSERGIEYKLVIDGKESLGRILI